MSYSHIANIAATQRTERLRSRALAIGLTDSGIRDEQRELLWYRFWLASRHFGDIPRRRGWVIGQVLAHITPAIGEELIFGRAANVVLSQDEREELLQYRKTVAPSLPLWEGQASHMAIDYDRLVTDGLGGYRSRIEAHLQKARTDYQTQWNHSTETEARERINFYEGALDALAGLSQALLNQAAACGQMENHDETAALEWIATQPPRTFKEAIQLVHFVTCHLEGLYQWGHPDRYLLPFYENDLAAGTLTAEEAQEWIDCACILFNENIPRGLAVGLMVGGRDADGKTVENALTWHFMQSIRHTRMAYPGVGLCCHEGLSEGLMRLAMDCLAEGHTHPALFNDVTITNGLLERGLPRQQACLYIHSTCVEITPCATSAVWVASPYINLLQLLLDLLDIAPLDGEIEGVCGTFDSFETLLEAYRRRLAWKVAREARDQNRQQADRARTGGDPLASIFVNDCIEKGRDLDRGGARYNWIMPSFVGLANLVDALHVMRKLVFEEKRYTTTKLRDMLQVDFENYEDERQYILHRADKYGNGESAVDELVKTVTSIIIEEVGRHTTFRGDRFVPSLFCWEMHARLGRETAASPDGRLAGFPLGDGSGPAQGREQHGPTASILSSTSWNHGPFIGGIAVNLKFTPNAAQSREAMLQLVRAFMQRGGFELQINVLRPEVLQEALEHPELHDDLVVRVGGYSDYFTRLIPEMQREVLQRTLHETI